ncbi:NAD-binding domain 4 protein [Mycena capillaripes]|nr:NAD-binding domain 4 protein [Mycena capillaripes]
MEPATFFRGHTIFLTGSTGVLGGCLLYKLALKVEAHKIYVLVRGSAERARDLWTETMPQEIEGILGTGRVQLVVGDVTEPHCGIDPVVFAEMVESVTVIIHAAAKINLKAPLSKVVSNNCMPTLHLAQEAANFRKLSSFVFVSTAYVNNFLPDGVVEERIYEVGDQERQLSEILDTGSVAGNVPRFISQYAFGKHLTERLLISRSPNLPLLIIRPTCIAPAISQPYPYYNRRGSCPMSTYIRQYMTAPDSGVIHVSPENPGGSNIVDEIPVDLVANLILLHIIQGSTGIFHAGAESYVPRTLAQLHNTICAHIPRGVPPNAFRYVSDGGLEEGRYAEFWGILGKNWRFSNAGSRSLAQVKGALSMVLEGHDAAAFMEKRVKLIAEEILTEAGVRLRSNL